MFNVSQSCIFGLQYGMLVFAKVTYLSLHDGLFLHLFRFHFSNLQRCQGAHILFEMVDLRVHVETLAPKVGEAGGVAALAGEGVGAGGPEGVLAHHLGLGVAVAGVEAVGPAGHRLLGPHRRVAEHLPGVAGAQLGAHAPGQPRLLAPLAALALVVQTPARTLPDAPGSHRQGYV